jgi:hypothetical protein
MKDATLIVLVLDRSGSIRHCLQPMQSMLDEFIETQRNEPGECELALYQFDDKYEFVWRGPIKNAEKHTIVPRNMTALHDAIGKTINDIGSELSNRPEYERPSKVVFCVITDGFENRSQEFTGPMVAAMVKLQQEAYQWNFVFLGANQNAVTTAHAYNIPAAAAMTYAATAGGVRGMSVGLNSYVARARSAPTATAMNTNAAFTKEEREDAVEENKATS